MRKLEVIDRGGPEEFSITLAFQMQLRDAKIKDASVADFLVLVEHEAVYTVGRGVPFQDVSGQTKEPVPWIEIPRGGEATFHGPGQVVAYPVFDLTRHGKDVHLFLRKLEESIILCLKRFGVEGLRREGDTGVWVEVRPGQLKKIAALGIGLKHWVSSHGLALNVRTDLSYFEAIQACGRDGRSVTSLKEIFSRERRPAPAMAEVKRCLAESMAQVFKLALLSVGEDDEEDVRERPKWLKARVSTSPEFEKTKEIVKRLELHTVCEEARCPNAGECWAHSTATFMIMGDLCTRRCNFCAVGEGTPKNLSPLNPVEPLRVARAVAELGLKHVVITSVNRDDLKDMGARQFDLTVRATAHLVPDCRIELLIPDMRGKRDLLQRVLGSGLVSVLNHNLETVPRLYREVRPGADYERSLRIIQWAKEIDPKLKTKSGLMVGIGEKREEIIEVMSALREVNCDILTIGQYLQPTSKQLLVRCYVTPEEFELYRDKGLSLGFSHVESGPLVRSSYHAWKHVL